MFQERNVLPASVQKFLRGLGLMSPAQDQISFFKTILYINVVFKILKMTTLLLFSCFYSKTIVWWVKPTWTYFPCSIDLGAMVEQHGSSVLSSCYTREPEV